MNEKKWFESISNWVAIILVLPIIISSVYTVKEVSEVKGILTKLAIEQGVNINAGNYRQYPLEERQENSSIESSTNGEAEQHKETYQYNANDNQTTPEPDEDDVKQTEIVYVTETGECYHRDGCKHLRNSRIEIDKQEAEKYYRPCKDCYPELYR